MSETQLYIWRSFVNGDQLAFRELYDSCFDTLYLYGQQFSNDPDTIKDIIQNIFIKIWERKQSLKEVNSPKAYLMQSFRNQMLNYLRSKKNSPISPNEINEEHYNFQLEVPIEMDIMDQERDEEVKEKLKNAIELLTSKQKELIYLKYVKDLEFAEVSSIMDVSIKSVYKLHQRTLLSLRKNLGNIDLLTVISYLNWIWLLYK